MKQYIHKSTGNIAVETHSGNNYRVTVPQNYTVPKWIVENSDEWEEIVNYDGVKFICKYEPNDIYSIEERIDDTDNFYIHWKDDYNKFGYSTYSKKSVKELFKNGSWIKIEESELQKSLCIHDLKMIGIQISSEQNEKLLEIIKNNN